MVVGCTASRLKGVGPCGDVVIPAQAAKGRAPVEGKRAAVEGGHVVATLLALEGKSNGRRRKAGSGQKAVKRW